MSGKPSRLMVSWRCTSAIARLRRRRSKRWSTRSRLASSIFCRRIGWSAEIMKNSHRTSVTPMGELLVTCLEGSPRYALVRPDTRIRAAPADERHERHAGDETADVGPPRHPARLAGQDQGKRAAQELHQEPEREVEHRGQLHHVEEDEDRSEEGDHPR